MFYEYILMEFSALIEFSEIVKAFLGAFCPNVLFPAFRENCRILL